MYSYNSSVAPHSLFQSYRGSAVGKNALTMFSMFSECNYRCLLITGRWELDKVSEGFSPMSIF